MFIEFIDQLRCTRDHEESWLVAAFLRREDRFILDATLGCHICLRQYAVRDGVAYFGLEPANEANEGTRLAPDEDMAMRAAAFLGAAERTTLVLGGSWGAQAHGVATLVPLRVFAFNPSGKVDDSEQVAVIRSSEGIPLSAGSVDGVALDSATATPEVLRTALTVLRPGGRLVAPALIAVPPEVTVLARDDSYWVGETSKPFIPLRRA